MAHNKYNKWQTQITYKMQDITIIMIHNMVKTKYKI